MIENDARTSNHGLTLGDEVDFRWNRQDYRGTVIRLMNSKAVIRIGEQDSRTVSYRQVKQSTKYSSNDMGQGSPLVRGKLMAGIRMARVKVVTGDIDNLTQFVAQCEAAGLLGRKADATMNFTGQIREEDLEALRKVHGVLRVEIRESYDTFE